MDPNELHGHVGDNGDDFTLKAIEESLQVALLAGHLEVETVYSVFHGATPILIIFKTYQSDLVKLQSP